MKPILISIDDKNNVKLSFSDLKKILDDAYNAGVLSASSTTYNLSDNTSITQTPKNWWDLVTINNFTDTTSDNTRTK